MKYGVGDGSEIEYLSEQPIALTIIIVCTAITVFLVVLLIEAARFLDKRVRPSTVSNHRITTWWMIAVFPVMSCVVLPGIYSPISASFCHLIASLCFSFTMFKFLIILVNYYGGYKEMVVSFSAENTSFSLASAPLFCCCDRCLPRKRLTRRSFKWLKIAVLQTAIFKPVTSFIGVVVWLDGVYLTSRLDEDEPFTFVNIANILSSMIAMMGLNMLYTASTEHLEKFNIGVKFTFIKLGILVCNVQPAVLGLFMRLRFLGCALPYTNQARANVLQCILLIVESGILFPFVRRYYRRPKGNVVGSASLVPSGILTISGISTRPIQLLPRPSITSSADGRLRGWTVIGSGDIEKQLSTIPEEKDCDCNVHSDEKASQAVTEQFSSRQILGRRHTIC
ncbi:organic solute transporter subunit alpha-like [Diadema antillarum]|uniref:organic solute transporter subunit alpha-like n=1 Tax=Diadema antillarum TaxID=105358 RepID=UPI003A846735